MSISRNAVKLHSRQILNPDSERHVVILHGLFAASDNLLRLGKDLSEHYNVHLLDLRNHGQSPHVEEISYELMAQDVASYLSDSNISEAILVGHSMGGKVAMQLALQEPNLVIAVIVGDIAPVAYSPGHEAILAGLNWLQTHPPMNRQEADEALAEFIEEPAVRQFLIKSLRSGESGKGLVWRFNLDSLNRHYRNIIAAPAGEPFEKPVLFIAGELSNYIQPEHQKETLALFPRAQLKIISGATHWLHAEKPELFASACIRFLDSIENS